MEALTVAQRAREALLSKKGENVVILDVRKLSNVTDYYVIVTGKNSPHIKALATEMECVLEENGIALFRRSGTTDSGWIVVDYLNVVIHIFSPDRRNYYDLERLWNDAPRIEA